MGLEVSLSTYILNHIPNKDNQILIVGPLV